MTQIHFTLDKDELQELISNSGANEASKLILTKLFNELMANQRVVSKVVHIAIGIDSKGFKNILGFMISDSESEETWQSFYQSMINRGLTNVEMVISDAHQGQVKAIQKSFTESVWQRCQVHFLRNVMDKLPKKNIQEIRNEIKELFRINDIDVARITKNKILEKHSEKYNKMCECLDQGFEDSFQYTSSNSTRYNRLKSTNLLERLNQEIRRREKVVRIFPNVESAERLIGSMLIDVDEDWITSTRRYIEFTHNN